MDRSIVFCMPKKAFQDPQTKKWTIGVFAGDELIGGARKWYATRERAERAEVKMQERLLKHSLEQRKRDLGF